MKKARLANGQIILAQQYQHAAHGGDLFCADPGCDAPMGFRKEALTHGSLALKSACFFSKNVKDHRHDCSAHAPSALQARARKSLEQAIREEKNIVINLNVPLTAQFNSVARVSLRQPSTDKVDKYVPVGARNIEDMLDYIDTISAKGGAAARTRTYVNYQGHILPLEDFVIDSKEKFRKLLNGLYLSMPPLSQAPPGPDAQRRLQETAGFPRLIRFTPTANSRAGRTGRTKVLRGTPVNIVKKPGQRIVLLQRADADDAFVPTLRSESVHMIARPSLHWQEAQRARQELADNRPVVFLNIHWNVVSAAQFAPDEKPAAKIPPAAPRQAPLNG